MFQAEQLPAGVANLHAALCWWVQLCVWLEITFSKRTAKANGQTAGQPNNIPLVASSEGGWAFQNLALRATGGQGLQVGPANYKTACWTPRQGSGLWMMALCHWVIPRRPPLID